MEKKKDASEHAKALSELGASKGGNARSEKLSPEYRSRIARKAAQTRWNALKGGGQSIAGAIDTAFDLTAIPKETHFGKIRILDRELPCSVLNNGIRVFSTIGLSGAFGSKKKGRNARDAGADTPPLPPFLASESFRKFIPQDLIAPLISPIRFKTMFGGMAFGYPAIVIPQICEVIIDANKAGGLRSYQTPIVEMAERLLRGFARVGVVALVDEATGYKGERERDELNKILEAYIVPALMPWTRTFPDEFFRQIYKVHGWTYAPKNRMSPRYVGKFINKYVYQHLPPGVLEKLRELNPSNDKYQRRHKHFQHLTPDTGNEHLDKQITVVTTLMTISPTTKEFEHHFEKMFPKKQQLEIPNVLDLELIEAE